jgi:hypothetical protein
MSSAAEKAEHLRKAREKGIPEENRKNYSKTTDPVVKSKFCSNMASLLSHKEDFSFNSLLDELGLIFNNYFKGKFEHATTLPNIVGELFDFYMGATDDNIKKLRGYAPYLNAMKTWKQSAHDHKKNAPSPPKVSFEESQQLGGDEEEEEDEEEEDYTLPPAAAEAINSSGKAFEKSLHSSSIAVVVETTLDVEAAEKQLLDLEKDLVRQQHKADKAKKIADVEKAKAVVAANAATEAANIATAEAESLTNKRTQIADTRKVLEQRKAAANKELMGRLQQSQKTSSTPVPPKKRKSDTSASFKEIWDGIANSDAKLTLVSAGICDKNGGGFAAKNVSLTRADREDFKSSQLEALAEVGAIAKNW